MAQSFFNSWNKHQKSTIISAKSLLYGTKSKWTLYFHFVGTHSVQQNHPELWKMIPVLPMLFLSQAFSLHLPKMNPYYSSDRKKTNSCIFASSFLTMESINQPENGWQKMSEQFFIMIELDRDSLIVFSSFIWWKQYTCIVYIHNMYIILFNPIHLIRLRHTYICHIMHYLTQTFIDIEFSI